MRTVELTPRAGGASGADGTGESRRQPRPSRHGPVAQLLIASSPLSLILVAYAVGDWIDAPIGAGSVPTSVNRLGSHLHVAATAGLDRRLFGVVPSVWLQARLGGGSAHWYDAVATLVYVSHFVAIPVMIAVAWFHVRERYVRWLTTVVTFVVIGVVGYVAYPAAPPWLASEQGVIGPAARTSGLGWHYLHLTPVADWIGSIQAGSNPVAAMPSLHAGSAMLITLCLWRVVSPGWRVALMGYVLLMGVSLVYTGEHYVVDVGSGWLTAAMAVLVVRLVVTLSTTVGPRARRATPRQGTTPMEPVVSPGT